MEPAMGSNAIPRAPTTLPPTMSGLRPMRSASQPLGTEATIVTSARSARTSPASPLAASAPRRNRSAIKSRRNRPTA